MSPSDALRNEHGQPVGAALPAWQPVRRPDRLALQGCRVRLEPLASERHADSLHAAFLAPGEGPHDAPEARWTYSGGMPFADAGQYRAWLEARSESDDPLFYAIVETTEAIVETTDERTPGRALGLASYLNIVPEHGSIEVGHIHFTPALRRTPAATEAMLLMMRHAFALGYRRYEWKCNALNAASRRAAERLGFRFEGIFRQHRVENGHSRDTAWFSLLDSEWPAVEARLERWLAPENFDAEGRQLSSLSALTQKCR
ncbi:GNAT family N-acetyltransferase [Halomonas alkalisoli]|uniref:GNAT family N-acetyltransferase n=1 Tax=Halomonas alkalisoli TaxID=2907158 RepID=UPI001F283155|nr:GNAT family protein [Halomonas alkalisoli]MCE9681929.1 GNAT family N-acetyltransferase [Halomonas alkalisoli]